MKRKAPPLTAVGISLEGKYILLDDDRTLQIVQMLDLDGNDTNNCLRCAGVVYRLPDGFYGVTDIMRFDGLRIARSS